MIISLNFGEVVHITVMCCLGSVMRGFVKAPELSKETQLFQWVLYCASRLYIPSQARNHVEWAMTQYDTWMQSAGTRLDLEVKSW